MADDRRKPAAERLGKEAAKRVKARAEKRRADAERDPRDGDHRGKGKHKRK